VSHAFATKLPGLPQPQVNLGTYVPPEKTCKSTTRLNVNRSLLLKKDHLIKHAIAVAVQLPPLLSQSPTVINCASDKSTREFVNCPLSPAAVNPGCSARIYETANNGYSVATYVIVDDIQLLKPVLFTRPSTVVVVSIPRFSPDYVMIVSVAIFKLNIHYC